MLSLPLTSLSTAHDADVHQQKFSWQKETHDLTFVIDSFGGRDSSQLIKVVQGTQVRHLIEIERLVKEGEQLVRQMQNQGVQMQAEQLPTSAIVRNPLLAIRWRLPNQKIRRIQIKFKSGKDFDTAFNRLHQIGLHMNGHNISSSPPRLPAPALSSPIGSSLTTSAVAEQSHGSVNMGAGLTCPPSRLAEISSRPHTASAAPTTFQSHPQGAADIRPSSAALGFNRRDALAINSVSSPLNPPVIFPRPQSATADILDRSFNNITSFSDQDCSTVEEAPRASTERPETAMLFNCPNIAESLPPRRELPFQRLSEPRSSGSDSARASDRPSTGLMGPPALPRSTVQRPGSSRSANSKDVELPPLPRPTVIENVGRVKQPMQQPPRTPNQDQNSFQRAKTSPNNHCENVLSLTTFSPLLSSPPLFKKSSSPAPTLPQSRNPSSADAMNLQGPISELLHHSPTIHTGSSASHQILNGSGASNTTIGTNDSERLAAYVMQPDEVRRAAINEFIFRNLESEEFLTLVEDMETAWARVALGMR